MQFYLLLGEPHLERGCKRGQETEGTCVYLIAFNCYREGDVVLW